MIKIFTKEDWIPPFADRPVFVLAPAIIMATTLMSFAVIPFAPRHRRGRPERRPAVLPGHVVAGRLQRGAGRLGVEQQVLLLGGCARPAQMLSYEVFMGLSLMGVVVLAGSFRLGDIVEAQQRPLVLRPAVRRAGRLPDRRRWPRRGGCPSTCPRPKANWWPATTRSTRA